MAELQDVTRRGPGDLIATEADWTYTRLSTALDNDEVAASVPVDNPTGYPVGVSSGGRRRILMAGEEADCVGFIVQGPPIGVLAEAGGVTPDKYAVLKNGPATVRPAGIADMDPAGAAYDKAALLTAVAALVPPIFPVDEAIETEFTNAPPVES